VNETAGRVWKFGVLAATRREKRKEIFLGLGVGRTQTEERISERQSQITTPHSKDTFQFNK